MLNVKNKVDSDTSTTTQARMKAGTATEKPTTVTRVSTTANQLCDICKSKILDFYDKRVCPSVSSARPKYEEPLFITTLIGEKYLTLVPSKYIKNKDFCPSYLAEYSLSRKRQYTSGFKWNFKCLIST